MPVSLSLTVDTKAVERDLARLAPAIRRKVIPAALNRTTDEALRKVRSDLPRYFTIRSPWVAKGFRTDKATPAKIEGRIFHRDQYLVAQEEGGDKTGRDGGHVAVPDEARPNPRAMTPRSKWPGKLKRTFVVRAKSGALLLYQRTGKKVGKRPLVNKRGKVRPKVARGLRNPNVKLMYVLTRRVRVKARWPFSRQVALVVANRWGVNVDGYLGLALNGRL